ncbi:hypothetical protein ACMYSQ_008246 [Aspergillus niger]
MSGRQLGYTADKYRIIRRVRKTERHQQRSVRQGKAPVSIGATSFYYPAFKPAGSQVKLHTCKKKGQERKKTKRLFFFSFLLTELSESELRRWLYLKRSTIPNP